MSFHQRRLALTIALAAGAAASVASAQIATMPPHATGFTGNTRGYWFTAPTTFMITGVQVMQIANPGVNGFQNWAIVRFNNNTPPPLFSLTTNDFVQLDFGLNQPANSFQPTSVVINAGDVIGIYGNTAATIGTTTGVNSYTATTAPATTDILGNTVTLNRSGMQFHLGSATTPQGMQNIWSEAANNVTRVEFTYSPVGTVGRCCLGAPNYNCIVTTATACQSQNGTYGGDGTSCTSNPCPPPPTGACCLQIGGCNIATQQACISGGGTYAGDNIACAAAGCSTTGRCCFSDGSCFVMTSAVCTAAGGTYGGNDTTCTTGACTQQPGNIACNGPFVTTPNGTCIPAGSFHSEVQVGNTIAGFNQNGALAPPFRIADNFTVPAGETWTVNGFTLYGYQTGAGTPVSSFTGSTCQIWNGRPGDVGSSVVAGDATTNVLTSSTFTNTYRTFNAACDLTRPIFANSVTLAAPAVLPAGTYWVDYNATGSLASGPWALNVTVMGLGSPPNADGRQLPQTGVWQDLLDGVRVQEAAFCIRGTVATTPGGCYANCDGSTGSPLLTANDFQCFLNKYAANDTYANCDGSTGSPLLTANDFQCFLNKYAAGCS